MRAFFQSVLLSFYLLFFVTAMEGRVHEVTSLLSGIEQLQTENDYTPKNFDVKGISNSFYIKPIFNIAPSCAIPWEQYLRLKLLLVDTLPRSNTTKKGTWLGDSQVLDLFLVEEEWGKWGVGGIAIIPTASSVSAGQGKWQLGPACGFLIDAIPQWQIGGLFQNPIAFAGQSGQSFVNTLYFQPSITYHLPEAWYLLSDAEWTIQWNKCNVQIPIGLGIGKVFDWEGRKYNIAVEGEWMLYKNSTKLVPQFTLEIDFNIVY